jgi:hypothetical protein
MELLVYKKFETMILFSKKRIWPLALVGVLFICCAFKIPLKPQLFIRMVCSADSAGTLTPNLDSGWNVYSSYVTAKGTDSVELEVILKQTNHISWENEYFIGSVGSVFFPAHEQVIAYDLVTDHWQIRVSTGGKCYLKLISGSIWKGDPTTIPIKTQFKIN